MGGLSTPGALAPHTQTHSICPKAKQQNNTIQITSKQTSKQASKQANKQTSKQANKQTRMFCPQPFTKHFPANWIDPNQQGWKGWQNLTEGLTNLTEGLAIILES